MNGSSYQNQHLKCQDCGRHFATKQSLSRHALSHGRILEFPKAKHQSDSSELDSAFVVKDVLSVIVNRIEAQETGVMFSPTIPNVPPLPGPPKLKKQINKPIQETVKFPCPECGKLLNSKKGLKQHLKLHEEKRLKRLAEGKPPMEIMNHNYNHNNVINTQLQPQQQQLPMTVMNMNLLNPVVTPVLRGDGSPPIWQCEICKKIYPNKHSLKRHIKTHMKGLLQQQQHQQQLQQFNGGVGFPPLNPTPLANILSQQQQQQQQQGGIPNNYPMFMSNGDPFVNHSADSNDSNVSSGSRMGNGVVGGASDASVFPEGMYKCECCGLEFTTMGILAMHALSHTEEERTKMRTNFSTYSHSAYVAAAQRQQRQQQLQNQKQQQQQMVKQPAEQQQTVKQQLTGEKEQIVELEKISPKLKCTMCDASFSELADMKKHLSVHIKTPEKDKKDKKQPTPAKRTTSDVSCLNEPDNPEDIAKTTETVPGKSQTRKEEEESKSTLTTPTKPEHVEAPASSINLSTDTSAGATERPSPAPSKRGEAHQSHQCPICEKTFATAPALGRHATKHAGDPFPCEICGKEFVKFNGLTRHMRNHVKQFHCHVCGKSFGENYTLKRHLRSHGEEGETVEGKSDTTASGTTSESVEDMDTKVKKEEVIEIEDE